jgi:hypothetical protein
MSLRFMYRNRGMHSDDPWGSISATITDQHIVVDLSIKYGSTLQLWIVPKTNKFLTNDNVRFSDYIAMFNIRLVAECNCGTRYETNDLDFQDFNKVIGATILRYEYITFENKGTRYTLYSDFNTERTVAVVSKNDLALAKSTTTITFDLPLLPKYKIRDKQKLIDKLKLYCVFS